MSTKLLEALKKTLTALVTGAVLSVTLGMIIIDGGNAGATGLYTTASSCTITVNGSIADFETQGSSAPNSTNHIGYSNFHPWGSDESVTLSCENLRT